MNGAVRKFKKKEKPRGKPSLTKVFLERNDGKRPKGYTKRERETKKGAKETLTSGRRRGELVARNSVSTTGKRGCHLSRQTSPPPQPCARGRMGSVINEIRKKRVKRRGFPLK